MASLDRRPLRDTLAEALHASGCCNEAHTNPGPIFTDMADAIIAMAEYDPSDRENGQCPFCGGFMLDHATGSGLMFRCGWLALKRAKEISET